MSNIKTHDLARLAREVMGWNDNDGTHAYGDGWCAHRGEFHVVVKMGTTEYVIPWAPHTDIDHAWMLVEAMVAKGDRVLVDCWFDDDRILWACKIVADVVCERDAPTAPLSITRAALAALEGKS